MKKHSPKNVSLISDSAEETMFFGKHIAPILKQGMVLALEGPLGSGKTTLTKGIVHGLFRTKKIKVTSPSFALINQYDGVFPVYHIDCYRLDRIEDYENIGIDECLFSNGISIVEWSKKIKTLLPDESIFIAISHRGENKRKFIIRSGDRVFMRTLQKELSCLKK